MNERIHFTKYRTFIRMVRNYLEGLLKQIDGLAPRHSESVGLWRSVNMHNKFSEALMLLDLRLTLEKLHLIKLNEAEGRSKWLNQEWTCFVWIGGMTLILNLLNFLEVVMIRNYDRNNIWRLWHLHRCSLLNSSTLSPHPFLSLGVWFLPEAISWLCNAEFH